MNSFYTEEELGALGLKKYGENVLISKKCSLYAAQKISIGNNVRIDDFCILSGNIVLGNYIHISAYSSLFAGNYSIILEDFTTVSSRCAIYAESDDYSGESPTNPMLPEICRTTYGGNVILKPYVIIGSGCTLLPNLTIGEGSAVGAMSLIVKDIPGWGIYGGVPCRLLKKRSKKLLERLPQEIVRRS
jgi:galactoside O-acetyltransferase